MSEYIVATPFRMGSTRLHRGQKVGQEIEKSKNFRMLFSDKFILPLYDKKTKEEFVDKCYIVVKSFNKGTIRFRPGHFVDLRGSDSFRNESTLLSAGFLKRATRDDVARHSAHSPLSGTPGKQLSGDAGRASGKLWKNPLWIKSQYIDEKKSIPEMCKVAGCSTSTMWSAIKSLDIETRPRGRPTSK